MSQEKILSFAEESCWDGEEIRLVKKQVVFVVRGFEKPLKLDEPLEFRSDYGLFWDTEDELLAPMLAELDPSIPWHEFLYQRLLDHSGIFILEPLKGRTIGSIRVRTGRRRILQAEEFPANVLSWDRVQQFKENRDRERLEQAEDGDQK